MNKNLLWAGILFAVQVVNYFFLRPRGFYTRYHYFDKFLHILAGIMFGCLWLWLIRKLALPKALVYFTIITAAVFGSVLWEFWEFGGHLLTPARMAYYVPDLADTLGDIAAGLLGGFLLSSIDFMRQKSRLRS